MKKTGLLLLLILSLGLSCFPSFSLHAENASVEDSPAEAEEAGSVLGKEPDELANLADDGVETEAQPGETEADEADKLSLSQEELEDLIMEIPRDENAWPSLEQISSAAYIVYDVDKDEIIFGENTEAEAYPASMTKIMTALVILEHPDYAPDKPIYFSERACLMPAPESTTCGFVPGEVAPTISCLYAMMMRSANEVANALAENYGGSIEAFCELMNQKAKDLGCVHTNFVDPCGFGYVNHHTTAEDLVKIIKQAMRHSLFRDLVTTKVYSLPPTNKHPMSGWSNIFNGNYLMLFSEAGMQSPWLKSIDGVKPGNTDLAGDCLAAAATTYDGRHLISIIFDAVYGGEYPNSFVGPCIMSHTLLEEGAKRIGAPRAEQAKSDLAYDAWPAMLVETEPEPSAEPTPSVYYTTAQASKPAPDYLAEAGRISLSRSTLIVIFCLLSLFIVLCLIMGYSLVQARKRARLRRQRREREIRR